MMILAKDVDWFAQELAGHAEVAELFPHLVAARAPGDDPATAKGYEIFIPVLIELFKKIQECRRLKNKLAAKAAIAAESGDQRRKSQDHCPRQLAPIYRKYGFAKQRHTLWNAKVGIAATRANTGKVAALMLA